VDRDLFRPRLLSRTSESGDRAIARLLLRTRSSRPQARDRLRPRSCACRRTTATPRAPAPMRRSGLARRVPAARTTGPSQLDRHRPRVSALRCARRCLVLAVRNAHIGGAGRHGTAGNHNVLAAVRHETAWRRRADITAASQRSSAEIATRRLGLACSPARAHLFGTGAAANGGRRLARGHVDRSGVTGAGSAEEGSATAASNSSAVRAVRREGEHHDGRGPEDDPCRAGRQGDGGRAWRLVVRRGRVDCAPADGCGDHGRDRRRARRGLNGSG
jgi:hypothetical protein